MDWIQRYIKPYFFFFKVMHLCRQNPRQNYTMGGTTLATTTSEKDLGVYVDTQLTFEKHIETVVNQANRMLGLIRRSYTYLDSQSLLKLYISLVRPTLEYANAAWTPILRRDQILLENVQRRATKLIPELRDRDYENRLRTLKLPSLYYRRARGDMIEAYKFTHSIYKTEQEPLQRDTKPRQEATLTSSRQNAVIRGLEPISSVTASPTDGTICVMMSSLPRV